jgi:uncharacterized membrane protein affecting hemolysin expression
MYIWAVGGVIILALLFVTVLLRWNHKMMSERKDFLQQQELEKLGRDLLRMKARNN